MRGARRFEAAGRSLAALAVCTAGGALFAAAGTVLPWMLGALVFMAAATMARWPVMRPPGGLQAGQFIVGIVLGLYFTEPVLEELSRHALAIGGGALFALALGTGSAVLLARLSRCDFRTAFFASLPGGAGEMSLLAERLGGRADWVAAAHALRILIVVLTVPPLITWSGAHGSDAWVAASGAVRYERLLPIAAAALLAALVLRALNTPNGWIIGPLLATIAWAGSGLEASAMPRWLVDAGQLLIGCALGSRFSAGFFRAAPRFLACVALTVVCALAIAAGFAVLLALCADLRIPTAVLATAPGGVAEMSLTASALHLGVPVVTSFHVTRMAFLVLTAAPLFALGERWRR